jgi:hypothetical protein
MSALVPLSRAALELGLDPSTLRRQIALGRLAAEKIGGGRDWYVSAAEVERYRSENLGRVGRPAGPRS